MSERERHARRRRRRRQLRRRRLALGGLALTTVGLLASGLLTAGHGDAARRAGERERAAPRQVAPCPVPTRFKAAFARAASRAGLEPALLVAVARAESELDPRAVSPKGARGLLQLMPETARALRVDAASPAENLAGGARYLRMLLDRFGSLRLALAAYDAGPTRVAAYGDVPPYDETQAYVLRVTRARRALSGCRFL